MMITMILRVVIKLVAAYGLLFLLPIAAAAAADEVQDPPPPVAPPNCAATCGNLMVPYPFGIGSGCFVDELCEIECHLGSDGTPVATLRNLMNVTVLDISLLVLDDSRGPGRFIEVSQPVFYSEPDLPHCMGGAVNGNITTSLNLIRSPYMYVQKKNVIVSGGCNNLAFMVNISMKSAVSGCRSTCTVNGTGSHNDCVNGIGCCMDTIPYGIQAYGVDFKTENGSSTVDGLCR